MAERDADNIATTVELCRLQLKRFPDDAPTWITYGRVLSDVSLFGDAEAAFRRAFELAPRHQHVYLLVDMGTVFDRRGDAAAAENCYRRAVATDEDHACGYIFLGGMLARQGRLEEAVAVHRRGTQCKRGAIDEAFHNLGLILRAMGRYDDAIASFDAALEIDPEYQVAKEARVDCLKARDVASGMNNVA